jgi:hypothetical protein
MVIVYLRQYLKWHKRLPDWRCNKLAQHHDSESYAVFISLSLSLSLCEVANNFQMLNKVSSVCYWFLVTSSQNRYSGDTISNTTSITADSGLTV